MSLIVFKKDSPYLKWASPVAQTINRDLGLIHGSGRSPGEGNGYPPQYFCLENSKDRGAWQATFHRVAESDMTEVT